MSFVIPMELNAIDSAIEGAATLRASLQRVLLETQESIQEYVATQQVSAEARKLINARFLAQYHQLKQVEHKARYIATVLQKNKSLDVNLERGLQLKLLNDSLPNDLIRIKQHYKVIYSVLKNLKELSLVSWSINRRLAKIHKSLDQILEYLESIQNSSIKFYRYSETDYRSYQKGLLASTAALSEEAINLSSEDWDFILDCMDKPPKPPSPAMKRALEHYAQCS